MEEDKLNKAIDLLKSEIEIYDKYYCLATSQALKTVLKELDRLQKENEELKIDNNKQWKERCRLSFELDDSIPKSVIQDKLKELKECDTSCLVEQIYNNGRKALCKELLNKGE